MVGIFDLALKLELMIAYSDFQSKRKNEILETYHYVNDKFLIDRSPNLRLLNVNWFIFINLFIILLKLFIFITVSSKT